MHIHIVTSIGTKPCIQESEVLIKAFKEHERRDGEKEGFAHTPADALAFKFYRDVSAQLQQQN